ncbi:hypothetical protein BDZ94DRAFT_1254168, partial [Collybia nuda]
MIVGGFYCDTDYHRPDRMPACKARLRLRPTTHPHYPQHTLPHHHPIPAANVLQGGTKRDETRRGRRCGCVGVDATVTVSPICAGPVDPLFFFTFFFLSTFVFFFLIDCWLL